MPPGEWLRRVRVRRQPVGKLGLWRRSSVGELGCVGGKIEVAKDFDNGFALGDGGDNFSLAIAVGTAKNVVQEHAL